MNTVIPIIPKKYGTNLTTEEMLEQMKREAIEQSDLIHENHLSPHEKLMIESGYVLDFGKHEWNFFKKPLTIYVSQCSGSLCNKVFASYVHGYEEYLLCCYCEQKEYSFSQKNSPIEYVLIAPKFFKVLFKKMIYSVLN